MSPKISLSINDLPFNISLKDQITFAKDVSFDGVEVVIGGKSRLTFKRIENILAKVKIPILSLHQPFWSILPVRDNWVFEKASKYNVPLIVHPCFNQSLYSDTAREYMDWLARSGEKYKVKILMENHPKSYNFGLFHLSTIHKSTTNLVKLKKICRTYGFGLTLDIDHFGKILPSIEEEFREVYTDIGNIHLSDFTKTREHLFLGQGVFDSHRFLEYLKKHLYKNLITFEMNNRVFMDKYSYFDGIRYSLALVRMYFPKE